LADANSPTETFDLGALFAQHRQGLAGAVRGILGPDRDVQEVLQEVFLRAWRHAARRPPPRDPVAWLFVVALNTARDTRRRRRRTPKAIPLEDVAPMQLESSLPAPTARLERSEALAAAQSAIHLLAEREREVFLLRVSGGLSFEATATALEIPVGTAKTRMRTALAHLRDALAAHAPDHIARREAR